MVYQKTGRKEIIYGTRALNVRFPSWLDRETDDYDIYSPTPSKDAIEVEKLIDKRMGFNASNVKKAQHEGTMKVVSVVTGKGIADFTKPEGKIPYNIIRKKKYVTLKHIEEGAKKILQDPESAYRHAKDQDTLQRIEIYRKYKKKSLTHVNKPKKKKKTINRKRGVKIFKW